MASSNKSAKQYVGDARENLVGRLQNLPLVVEKLHQKKVFNGNEVSEIEAEPEKYNKSRKILDFVLNKGEEACYQFLLILYHERKLVLPKTKSSSRDLDLHTWICLFSFRDEAEDYNHGPQSCQDLQKYMKTSTRQMLGQQWMKSQSVYGEKGKEDFTFIPLVLDTNTTKYTPHNKVKLKSKKSKKPRTKKMKAYIPRDTQGKSPEDLLNSKDKNILIVGKPGIGKTTVVKQMLHHWAKRNDRTLDFMFYFDENTLSNTSAAVTLEELLLSTFFISDMEMKTHAEEIMQYLQEYSERVTIVFDGISGDFLNNTVFLKIMENELLPEAKIVATCRSEEEYELSHWPTCTIYVQGFSEESIYDFFSKMSHIDPELVDSVINNPALFSLCHVPMYAFMVAACIQYYSSDEVKTQCTATELYVRIFRHCLQRHGNKKLRHLDVYIKNCRDMVLSLAECAFNATKLKTINLEFDYDEKNIATAFLKTATVVSPAFARNVCAFPHNTMQEFFSALWLLEKTEILDEMLQLCQNEETQHIKYVIPFLCGLHSQANIPLLKCLFPVNKVKENTNALFEKVLNTFFCDDVDITFICQCLYEFQSPEFCCSFLKKIDYCLDFSQEHLDPYTCCAVSYVISNSRNEQVHLDLEKSAVSLSGLRTILKHSQYLRDFSATLCQVWTMALKYEELSYLIHLVQLCENEIHIPMSSHTDVLAKAGIIVTQNSNNICLHLHCDQDPQQLKDLVYRVLSWLPHISVLQFDVTHGEKEHEKRCRTFRLNLCLQAALHHPQNIHQSVHKILPSKEQSDFLLDLYSHVKQYESETGSSVLPALLPVYQSVPDVWSINLSERKVSLLLEVLKLQIMMKPVELRDCTGKESEVRSFLQCLPYISQLRFNKFESKHGTEEQNKRLRKFTLDLCLQAALHQPQNIQETVKKVTAYDYKEQSDFLLDLFSHVKQYESETGSSVLPALLPVYQSVLFWTINLSERKVSLLLEVLKLQTKKKPVDLRDCTGEESEVRSFLQCLPHISYLWFNQFESKHGTEEQNKSLRKFTLDLCLQAALHQPQHFWETVQKVIAYDYKKASDFLLDLCSHVKQYESKTGSSVLPALLPVYQSVLFWTINLSERKVSLLLEVLKLQTEKKPVDLRDFTEEESEVRSFLQCLPYISHLRFNEFESKHGTEEQNKRFRKFTLDLCLQAALHQPQNIRETVEKVIAYSHKEQSDFLLDLCSHVKQYESETGSSVLPALLPVYQSVSVWSINLSERKVSIFLEVLKLQTQKKLVELRDCTGEESEVRSFLQCLPYISQLRFNEFESKYGNKGQEKRFRKFKMDLYLQASSHQPQNTQQTVEKVMTLFKENEIEIDDDYKDYYYKEQSDFLLDLYSHVKQYESETGSSVLPALLPVYQSGPDVWSINLSKRNISLLLEVLKLQTQKKPVDLRDCTDEESKVRSFLQCLPYISQLRCVLNTVEY
ncbi:uncharacterized protein LOC124382011 isoform X2 [Silurus meridionalis]|uniref:uncharacterized protein LOC124382011 isoform X2 n=1 Tax=Silurus meridionalis TaxID=175797 RepID=UPI001EEB00EC|nr:uncharacterized protein LOC124382011 isoform X2 [Silurus meridionalis]